MSHAPFDASHGLTFDLARGNVQGEGGSTRVILPADVLATLLAAAGDDATRTAGSALGEAMGKRVASRLGEGPEGARAASLEGFAEHLGGELALAGLGSLGLERWGRALVLVVDHAPLGPDGDALLGAVLASALSAATAREVVTALLHRDGARARFFAGSPVGVALLVDFLTHGASWCDALAKLHAERGEA